jgi:hypothetical protein
MLKEIFLPETITTIKEHAFEGCVYLEDVHLPNGLKENIGVTLIDTYAFNNASSLKIEQSDDYDPFAKLTKIGVAAFYKCKNGIYITKLSKTLNNINGYAFYDCPNVSIEDFSNLKELGSNALGESGKNKTINIILPTALDKFVDNCFSGYAIGNINTVTYFGGGSVEDTVLARLGLSYSNPTTIEQVIEYN